MFKLFKKDRKFLGFIFIIIFSGLVYLLFFVLNKYVLSINNMNIPPIEPSTLKLISICSGIIPLRKISSNPYKYLTSIGMIWGIFFMILIFVISEYLI